MKKILAFLLVAIMVVALVACNSGSGTTTTATDKVETTEATTVVTTEATTQATTEVTTVETTEATTEATTEVTTEETTTEETTTAVVIDPNDVDAILTAAYALKDGEALTGEFTLEGVVTKVGTAYSAQYQNVTFTIAVEGQEARPIDAYRAKGEGADTVKVGDTVPFTAFPRMFFRFTWEKRPVKTLPADFCAEKKSTGKICICIPRKSWSVRAGNWIRTGMSWFITIIMPGTSSWAPDRITIPVIRGCIRSWAVSGSRPGS